MQNSIWKSYFLYDVLYLKYSVHIFHKPYVGINVTPMENLESEINFLQS